MGKKVVAWVKRLVAWVKRVLITIQNDQFTPKENKCRRAFYILLASDTYIPNYFIISNTYNLIIFLPSKYKYPRTWILNKTYTFIPTSEKIHRMGAEIIFITFQLRFLGGKANRTIWLPGAC